MRLETEGGRRREWTRTTGLPRVGGMLYQLSYTSVDKSGFEPLTSRMPTGCSTN